MEKKISYLARTFDDVKGELIQFSKKYYPELSDNFNDASVGAWFIDLVSAVGDDLAYHTDRMYQETNVNSANSKASVLNNARMNGVKVPGPKAAICEVEISCVLPVDTTDTSKPMFSAAPTLRRGGTVGNSSYTFELSEDVNFAEQFNSDGISNRKFTPNRDNNGTINGYTVTKNTIVRGGRSKIYKKLLTDTEVKPFMEVVLPEVNIMDVESILFKESTNFNTEPQNYEFYVDEEEFKVSKESIKTYRYFEVDSLADQFRFGTKTQSSGGTDDNRYIAPKQSEYTDWTSDGGEEIRRYFDGVWKPVSQKFITEYTDNGYLKVIFGSATDIEDTPVSGSTYGESIMSRVINNKQLGLLPKVGWTMFVLYRVGGGTETNLASGAINTLLNVDAVFSTTDTAVTQTIKSNVISSFTVTNPTTSVAGKDMPSTEELKYLVKYSIPAMKRCVTVKDYKERIMQIPPKYGCPFRCNAMEDNNKVVIPMLCVDENGLLVNAIPSPLVDNITEYLTHYKAITDFVELQSGRIFNLGFEIDVFIDKNYTTADVISTIIESVKSYMDVNAHDMGEDIFVGDLQRELGSLDGVISLIDMRVYTVYDADGTSGYGDKCKLPIKDRSTNCNSVDATFNVSSGAAAEEIDLDAIDGVLYADYDSMFEIKNPNADIQIRAKVR
jgi:hypothetical protein